MGKLNKFSLFLQVILQAPIIPVCATNFLLKVCITYDNIPSCMLSPADNKLYSILQILANSLFHNFSSGVTTSEHPHSVLVYIHPVTHKKFQ